MRCSLAIGATLLASIPAVAGAAPDPEAYIPPDAAVVVHWAAPDETLTRLESLARSAALAPPRARSGWLRDMLAEQQAWMTDIDLGKPAWLAVRFLEVKGQPEPEPELLLVVGLAGAGKKALDFFEKEGAAAKTGPWLVATSASSVPEPRKEAFAFPKSARELRAKSDLAMFMDLDAFPLDAMASEGLAPSEAAQLRQSLAMLGDASEMSIGVGLDDAGASLLAQSHPEPDSELAKLAASQKNTKKPLITGLPEQEWAMLFGAITDPELAPALAEQYLEPMMAAAAETEPELARILEKLMTQALDEDAQCSEGSFGLAIPGALERAFFLSRSTCENGKAARAVFTSLVPTVNELLEMAEKEGGEQLGFELAAQPSAREVAGVRFGTLSLEKTSKRGALEGAPPWVFAPLMFGRTKDDQLLSTWNAPDEAVKALVAAAPRGEPVALEGFRGAQSALVSPRMSEGYLRLAPIASALMPPELAPLRVLLSTLPPVAMASKAFPDGSTLTQVWLPKEIAQLAAAGMQMMRAPQSIAPPPPPEPESSGEEKPKKKI